MRNKRRAVALLLCALFGTALLAGCGSMKPLPSDTFYRLNIDHRAVSGASAPWTDGVIRVGKFRATGVHRERPIAHAGGDHIVVNQHRYHLWIDSPERMLQTELISYLRAAGASPTVTGTQTADAALEISASIQRMDHVMSAVAHTVLVAVSFEVVDRANGNTIVLSRGYSEERTVESDDMPRIASAMSDAVSGVFARFVAETGSAIGR